MKTQRIHIDEVIQKTQRVLHSFYHRAPETTSSYMAEEFVWIGANDFQWCQSREEFIQTTRKEYEEPDVMIYDEEYYPLFHERNSWIIYGRFKICCPLEDGSSIYAHVRVTFVWKKIGDELKLLHVHGSNAQDIPIHSSAPPEVTLTKDSSYFQQLSRMEYFGSYTQKLSFHDTDGKHHFLLPAEILYLESSGQQTVVHTVTETFPCFGLLKKYEEELGDPFMRVQKAYLVNLSQIRTIFRYKAVLFNGEELPIGRNWYTELKDRLIKQNNKQGGS